MVARLSAGLSLYATSRIVQVGESKHVPATVALYPSLFNLFSGLLSLFGISASND
jgi:modulator of FtsH protease